MSPNWPSLLALFTAVLLFLCAFSTWGLQNMLGAVEEVVELCPQVVSFS